MLSWQSTGQSGTASSSFASAYTEAESCAAGDNPGQSFRGTAQLWLPLSDRLISRHFYIDNAHTCRTALKFIADSDALQTIETDSALNAQSHYRKVCLTVCWLGTARTAAHSRALGAVCLKRSAKPQANSRAPCFRNCAVAETGLEVAVSYASGNTGSSRPASQ